MFEDQRSKLQEVEWKVRCMQPVMIPMCTLPPLTAAKRTQLSVLTTESSTQSECTFEDTTRWEQNLLAKNDTIKALQVQVSAIIAAT